MLIPDADVGDRDAKDHSSTGETDLLYFYNTRFGFGYQLVFSAKGDY